MNNNLGVAGTRLFQFIAASTALLAFTFQANAAVQLPAFFSDHMVLQTGRPVPVRGKVEPKEKVTVSIGGQTKTTEAGQDGKWSVNLDSMPPGGPLTLTVQGGDAGKRTVEDVLVGEVWLCSGQSNMALTVNKAMNYEKEQPVATWPKIRMMQQAGKWIVCSPESVGTFSAAAYFFGREIHKKTGMPVGLLNLSSGGTPIELWTSLEAQKAVPELKPLFESAGESAIASKEDAEQANSDRNQATEVEGKKAVAGQKVAPGYLFNGRILPLVPYAIRGVIWYQGEANSYTVNANLYGIQLATMIRDWRSRWGYDFAFISVQLPDIGSPQTEPVQTHGRVLVRDGVLKSLSLPNTGMAVTIGTGEEKSNHPRNKQEAGRRLAQWALATVYEQKDVAGSGPLPESSKVVDGKVVVTFSHADGGLVAQGGGELKGFAIAGADMKWVWGKATIDGKTVVVSSPEVKAPVAVRYAWALNPSSSNLYNGAGLPATPFRTDNEPLSNAYMH
ncbi:MAG TPA: sialate O-acetylesterase [Lentisphaeria bacterium]|nr:sialate O-acetylesterase [Lentisphaeria bacterium]